jgi:hypothetical protein
MLKYGNPQIISNGVSKSISPRNLTYRQKESITNITNNTTSSSTSQNILSTIGGNTNTDTGTGGNTGGGTTDNIVATTGDFVRLSANTLLVDIIKRRTATKNQVFVNDNLFVSDSEQLASASFSHTFSKDTNLYSGTLNIDTPVVTFRDNVIKFNSAIKSSSNYTFSENLNLDSAMSGFLFPNINETDGIPGTIGAIANNAMLFMPANYYLDFNSSLRTLSFTKYNNNYHFKNDSIGNNIRFTKTNYNFTRDSTYNKNTFNYSLDSQLNSVNTISNLLNIEAKNLALGNGDIILLNGVDFNPTNANNTPQGKSFNFKFWDINNTDPLSILKIEKTKATFSTNIVDLNPNLTTNNTDTTNPKLQFKDTNSFTIGKQDFINGNVDFIKFTKTENSNSGKITFLQPIDISGGSQGVSLIGPVLDFSGNGEVFFTDNVNFNSNNVRIVTFNKDFVSIKPELRLIGNNPFLRFSPDEFRILDISNNAYVGYDSISKTNKFYQPIDLSANGNISYNTAINFSSRGINTMAITRTSIDISANMFLRNPNSTIKFNTQTGIIDQLNTNYITFNSGTKKIIFNRPLDFSGNGIINMAGTNPTISFTTSTSSLFTVSQTSFDTSANLNFLNPTSIIRLPFNGSLNFRDIANFTYLGLDTITKSLKFYQPIEFADVSGGGVQNAIKFNTNLDLINRFNTTVASFSSTQLSLNGNIVMNNNSNIKVNSGIVGFIDSSDNYLLTMDNTTKIVTLYNPLQLSSNGNILFTNTVNFINNNSTFVSITPSFTSFNHNMRFLHSNPRLQFSIGELQIADISNNLFMGFNRPTNKIVIYRPTNISQIEFTSTLDVNDNSGNNFLNLDKSTNLVTFAKPINFASSGIIRYSGSMDFFNKDINVNILTLSNSIDISANMIFKNSTADIAFTNTLDFNDNSGNNFINLNKSTNLVTFAKPINFVSSGTIRYNGSMDFFNKDINANIVTLTNSINLNANMILNNSNPDIIVNSGELSIRDVNNNKVIGFDGTTIAYQPLRINNSIDFSGNGIIKYDTTLSFNDGTSNIITFDKNGTMDFKKTNSNIKISSSDLAFKDSSNNNILGVNTFNINNRESTIKTFKSFDPKNITFSENELLIKDDLNISYLGFNKLNRSIKFYQPLDISGITIAPAPITNINFSDPTFPISDTSGGTYLIFDRNNNVTRVYNPLDFSYGRSIFTVKAVGGNDLSANPIIKYDIYSNTDTFEKKYLAKTQIIGGNGTVEFTFRNIIETLDQQLTFTGKLVSRDSQNNSASYTFQGFTKYKDTNNPNFLEFELNNLYSSDPKNWTIQLFNINNYDLKMQIKSAQSTTTTWVVSIDSISV